MVDEMKIRRKWRFFFLLMSAFLLMCAPFYLISLSHLGKLYSYEEADSREGAPGAVSSTNETYLRRLEEINKNLVERIRTIETKKNCQTEYELSRCEVIHVAVVCAKFNSARDVSTLLKSLIFYRKNKLRFHFFSDAIATKILQVLFETWTIPAVEVSFYSTEQLKNQVDWIQNKHYSGIYGLMKLLLPDQLPSHLDKVIVLDTDITFTADVSELWKQFQSFEPGQAIGMVENQSPWYLGTLAGNRPWPAVGRGYNTGVILLNLERLRSLEWNLLWVDTANRNLKEFISTSLADQDIFNAVVKEHPSLVRTLSCEWNVQLGDNTLSEQCYTEVTDTKIIHWNSPLKMNAKSKHAAYFRNLFLTFHELDGNLLRRKFFGCQDASGVETDPSTSSAHPGGGLSSVNDYIKRHQLSVFREEQASEDEECSDFYREKLIVRRVHLYYVQYSEKLLSSSSPSPAPAAALQSPSSVLHLPSTSTLSLLATDGVVNNIDDNIANNIHNIANNINNVANNINNAANNVDDVANNAADGNSDVDEKNTLLKGDGNKSSKPADIFDSILRNNAPPVAPSVPIGVDTEASENDDVTLVAQLSLDRLQMLEMVASVWQGPISLSLYMSDSEVNQFLQFCQGSPSLASRDNIGSHVVYKEGQYYPINYLRNVALGQVNTRYALLTDIDFLPVVDLYEKIKRHVASLDLANKKRALVIPAFETERYKAAYPSSKSELLGMLRDGDLYTFRYHVWPQGQAATDYEKWKEAEEPYQVSWEPNYEPFIVIDRSAPRYDERFLGFGWNKVSHIMEVDAAGYELWVVPDVFILHLPHSPSLDIARYRASESYRYCLRTLKEEFLKDLSRSYGIRALKYLSPDN